jgi:hypothetical protein
MPGDAGLLPQERHEPLLLEVVIVRQCLRQTTFSHHRHRDAVNEAVGLVRTLLVKSQSSLELIVGLFNNLDERMCLKAPDGLHGSSPHAGTLVGECGEGFEQHHLGRDDPSPFQSLARRQRLGMPLVARVRQSDPVQGVSEHRERRHFLAVP